MSVETHESFVASSLDILGAIDAIKESLEAQELIAAGGAGMISDEEVSQIGTEMARVKSALAKLHSKARIHLRVGLGYEFCTLSGDS